MRRFLLSAPHAGVDSVFFEQGVVTAAFDDLAVIKDEDFVGIDHGGKTVGDDQRRAVA